MDLLLKNTLLNSKVFQILRKIVERKKVESYIIGGAVRDMILNNHDPKDVDIVCVGNAVDIGKELQKKLVNSSRIKTFKNYGTAMFSWNNVIFEFVGARKESYSEESRNPKVSIGSLKDDQNRRDFTINCLAISLNSSNFGSLIDPFNGLNDIKKRILRTPLDPDKTFSDDPLRMMRAIRFATQLDFKIENATTSKIKIIKKISKYIFLYFKVINIYLF